MVGKVGRIDEIRTRDLAIMNGYISIYQFN